MRAKNRFILCIAACMVENAVRAGDSLRPQPCQRWKIHII